MPSALLTLCSSHMKVRKGTGLCLWGWEERAGDRWWDRRSGKRAQTRSWNRIFEGERIHVRKGKGETDRWTCVVESIEDSRGDWNLDRIGAGWGEQAAIGFRSYKKPAMIETEKHLWRPDKQDVPGNSKNNLRGTWGWCTVGWVNGSGSSIFDKFTGLGWEEMAMISQGGIRNEVRGVSLQGQGGINGVNSCLIQSEG